MNHISKLFRQKPIILMLGCLVFILSGCHKPGGGSQPSFSTTPYVYPAMPDYVPPVQLYIPADNPETVEGVALGRDLFYDSILSSDNHHACASCHHQEYAFTDRGNPLSKGVKDSLGTFNSMALFNIPWERGGFFWNARAPILDSQIVGPVPNTKEMNLPWSQAVAKLQASPMYPGLFNKAFGTTVITKELTVKAIAQFLRTIISYNSKFDSVQQGLASFDSAEYLGQQLFGTDPVANSPLNPVKGVPLNHRIPGTGLDCFHCHALPDFVPETIIPNNEVLMNDGLGIINLKVPSLRNNKFSAPYMSDGSFATLDSVIDHYDHGVDPKSQYVSDQMYAKKYTGPNAAEQLATPHMELSAKEKAALIAFLNTLNDYSLLTNKAYSNPFIH
jgi:cytochrome c peroxidase